MAPVTVLILAPAPDPAAGPLARVLEQARAVLAERHRAAFLAAGASNVRIHREPPDDTPFGTRLRRLLPTLRSGGLVVLGAGSAPLATAADLAPFVAAAGADEAGALANSRFSADIVAVSRAAEILRDLPADLAADNALPRWLAEVAGVPVAEAASPVLRLDVDSPLDLVLVRDRASGLPLPARADVDRVTRTLEAVRAVACEPSAELFVAGRASPQVLAVVETRTAARTRVLVEERGLKTAQLAAARGRPNRRPPRSLLGELLLRDGPKRLGIIVGELADAALIDSRVLLAARAGADERGWPSAEDRFASDLLLPDRISDPWLRSLTQAAVDARIPIVLGGHTLVGPGLSLALGLEG